MDSSSHCCHGNSRSPITDVSSFEGHMEHDLLFLALLSLNDCLIEHGPRREILRTNGGSRLRSVT